MSLITDKDLREAVARGVSLLDKVCPSWRREVDVAWLDMTHARRCVLGQVFGDYVAGKHVLQLTFGDEHGFTAAVSPDSLLHYEILRILWTEEIARE